MLTSAQAKMLRDLRPKLRAVEAAAKVFYEILGVLDKGCGHAEGDYVDSCPVCHLDRVFAGMEVRNFGNCVGEFRADVDCLLLKGPLPGVAD